MKKVFSILMITVIMLPSLSRFGIIIDFKINQDYIAKVLCIQKEEVVNTCNGKCHLSKQLKKAKDQEEQKSPTSKKENFEILCYLTKRKSIQLSSLNLNHKKLNTGFRTNLYNYALAADIFHPPKFNLI